MARDTRRAGQVVVVTDVALRALQAGVRSVQNEARSGVIKRSPGPGCRAVAYRAIGREPGSHVTWIVCVLEVGQVARSTSGAGEIEVAVNVALGTRDSRVRASQWESRCGVVKIRRLPRSGGMAAL